MTDTNQEAKGRVMTMGKIRALASGGLLLVLAQGCLAEESRTEMFNGTWELMGQPAAKELAALSKDGRAAYQKALIACSLYADEDDNQKYKTDCQRAYEYFSVEYATSPVSFISLLFKAAMSMTSGYNVQMKLDYQRGRRSRLTESNLGKMYIDVLKKVYRDTRSGK